MASSSETMKDVEKQWSNICLDEEEEFVTELEEDASDEVEYDDRWCLIGKLLSGKISDYQVFQNIIADLWKPGKGMYVKILEQNRFLFQFYHEIDIDRVITGSPWTYDRKQLLIERLRPGDNPRTKPIHHLDLWVQIHNLQPGFKTDNVVRQAAKYMGSFLETDLNNFKGVWREYLRVRVRMNTDLPLKRRMKFRRVGGETFYANFKYERVPTFCFICGIMGHSERFCKKLYELPADRIDKPYSIEMKAPSRRQNFLVASPWLRSAKQHVQSGDVDGEGSDRGAGVSPQSKEAFNSVSNHGKSVYSDYSMPANHLHNNRDADITIVNGVNGDKGPSIVINDNDSTFMSDDELTILDLKRKR
ncbi:hypothetical protein G4B88_022509 [Cannabis sativa]|uniref:CCHC-type domain-containing protein n=1 Tax=Cannabis sativa TaxID=3483 RepID=A0A7J6HW27_CANSA|nr:hypothetical protein G4B88_022509 [Cannabis sativa]